MCQDDAVLDCLIGQYSRPSESGHLLCGESLPLVYCPEYNITFGGIERLHPFDTGKWGRVVRFVADSIRPADQNCRCYLEPNGPISDEDLLLVHDSQFLRSQNRRQTIVSTTEVCLFYLLPLCAVHKYLLRPLRYQTNGTILAAYLALRWQTAINIGGGFHHCSSTRPGGFCFYADITIAVRKVWQYSCRQQHRLYSILIVDCDAHQGNGYGRDVLRMSRLQQKSIYILDLYNPRIYPRDEFAKQAIDREVLLPPRVEDEEYLKLLQYHLEAVVQIDRFSPDLIIFNAGTDILAGDRLGRLRVSAKGVIERDETVFRFAHTLDIPVLMLLSGGYQANNARVISASLINLVQRGFVRNIPL